MEKISKPAVEPVNMKFKMKQEYLCGKRGSKPYINAIRPNNQNVCPDGTIPCSELTTAERTICITFNGKGKRKEKKAR